MRRRCLGCLGLALVAVLAGPAPARAACSVTQGDFDGDGLLDLRILGDTLPQHIAIVDGTSSYHVQVDCNNDGDFTDVGDIDVTGAVAIGTYDVRGGGQDRIDYSHNAVAVVGAAKDLLVSFGPVPAGKINQLSLQNLNLQGGSSLTVDVAGSAGADYLFLGSLGLANSSFILHGDLGAGDDNVFLGGVVAGSSSFTADV